MTKLVLKNEFGEQVSTAQDLEQISDALPAKTGVEALTAIATSDAPTQTAAYVEADVQAIATLANDLKAKVNDIIAALKVVS